MGILTSGSTGEATTGPSTGVRRRPLLVVAAPGLLIGVLTSLHHLLRPALWYDEASSVGATHDLLGTMRQSGATMATYYPLLRIWATVSSDPAWLRALSLLLALGALVAVVVLMRRATSDLWAGWTGVFMAMSYLWADQSAEARSYPLALLLVVLSWLVLDRLVEDHDEAGLARPAAYALLWFLLPPTHGLTFIIAGAQVVTLLLARPPRRVLARAAPGVAVALVTTAVLYLLGANGVTNWVQPFSSYGVTRLVLASTAPTELLAAAMGAVMLLGVVAGIGRWRSTRDPAERFRALTPTTWALLPITGLVVISVVSPLLVPRYLVMAVPGVAALLAAGVAHVGTLVAVPRRRVSVAVAAAIVVIGLLAAQLAIRDYPDDRWDQVVQLIAADQRDGDALLLPERRNRVPFDAAWDAPGESAPELVDFVRQMGGVRYVEPERSPAAAIRSAADHDRIWLVYQKVFAPSIAALAAVEGTGVLQEDYRLAGTWDFDRDIEVRLYVRR